MIRSPKEQAREIKAQALADVILTAADGWDNTHLLTALELPATEVREVASKLARVNLPSDKTWERVRDIVLERRRAVAELSQKIMENFRVTQANRRQA